MVIEDFDYFFKTIQSRGFANKMTPPMVQLKAKILDYTTICQTIESLMVSYTETTSKQSFATFIITTLLQTTHELKSVEQ